MTYDFEKDVEAVKMLKKQNESLRAQNADLEGKLGAASVEREFLKDEVERLLRVMNLTNSSDENEST